MPEKELFDHFPLLNGWRFLSESKIGPFQQATWLSVQMRWLQAFLRFILRRRKRPIDPTIYAWITQKLSYAKSLGIELPTAWDCDFVMICALCLRLSLSWFRCKLCCHVTVFYIFRFCFADHNLLKTLPCLAIQVWKLREELLDLSKLSHICVSDTNNSAHILSDRLLILAAISWLSDITPVLSWLLDSCLAYWTYLHRLLYTHFYNVYIVKIFISVQCR